MNDIESSIDFRLLLNKYIEHVGQCEGVDFINRIGESCGSDVYFSPAEVAELEILQTYPAHTQDNQPQR